MSKEKMHAKLETHRGRTLAKFPRAFWSGVLAILHQPFLESYLFPSFPFRPSADAKGHPQGGQSTHALVIAPARHLFLVCRHDGLNSAIALSWAFLGRRGGPGPSKTYVAHVRSERNDADTESRAREREPNTGTTDVGHFSIIRG